MDKMTTSHSLENRLNGINENCSLSQEDIKKCFGYGVVGCVACDSRNRYGYEIGEKFKLCVHFVDKKKYINKN